MSRVFPKVSIYLPDTRPAHQRKTFAKAHMKEYRALCCTPRGCSTAPPPYRKHQPHRPGLPICISVGQPTHNARGKPHDTKRPSPHDVLQYNHPFSDPEMPADAPLVCPAAHSKLFYQQGKPFLMPATILANTHLRVCETRAGVSHRGSNTTTL